MNPHGTLTAGSPVRLAMQVIRAMTLSTGTLRFPSLNSVWPMREAGITPVGDAITSTRPYRPARSLDEARTELKADVRDGRFESGLVDEFLRLMDAGIIQPGQRE